MAVGQGIYVSLVGMFLVFLSLTVLMFITMGLERLFRPPEKTAEPPVEEKQPESMAVEEEPEVAAIATALLLSNGQPGPETLKVTVDGKTYTVEVRDLNQLPVTVIVNGKRYVVELSSEPSAEDAAKSPGLTQPQSISKVAESETRIQPVSAAGPAAEAGATPTKTITAPMPGKILEVKVGVGESVAYGQEVCSLEAMKMEQFISSPYDGAVKEIRVRPGQNVSYGEILVVLE